MNLKLVNIFYKLSMNMKFLLALHKFPRSALMLFCVSNLNMTGRIITGMLQDMSTVFHHQNLRLRRQLVSAQHHGIRRCSTCLWHHQLHRRWIVDLGLQFELDSLKHLRKIFESSRNSHLIRVTCKYVGIHVNMCIVDC